jgi:hypothetical protein
VFSVQFVILEVQRLIIMVGHLTAAVNRTCSRQYLSNYPVFQVASLAFILTFVKSETSQASSQPSQRNVPNVISAGVHPFKSSVAGKRETKK